MNHILQKNFDSRHGVQKAHSRGLSRHKLAFDGDGLSYRLGYLQGHLKAYETEEDLLVLVKSKKISPSTP